MWAGELSGLFVSVYESLGLDVLALVIRGVWWVSRDGLSNWG